MTSLKYRVIDQKSSNSATPYPTRIVSTSNQAPEEYRSASSIDWDKEFLVFLGMTTPTPSYVIDVKRVTQTNDKLKIDTVKRSLGGMQLMVIAHKTVVIAVERAKGLAVPTQIEADLDRSRSSLM